MYNTTPSKWQRIVFHLTEPSLYSNSCFANVARGCHDQEVIHMNDYNHDKRPAVHVVPHQEIIVVMTLMEIQAET